MTHLAARSLRGPRCIANNPAAESWSLAGLYEGRLKQAVAPPVSAAGGYCEWVLALAAGVQARAVEATIDRCLEFQT